MLIKRMTKIVNMIIVNNFRNILTLANSQKSYFLKIYYVPN